MNFALPGVNPMLTALSIILVLFFLMSALMEIGRRVGLRQRKIDLEAVESGLGAIDGAVFGLMGLLIAFHIFGSGGALRKAATLDRGGGE